MLKPQRLHAAICDKLRFGIRRRALPPGMVLLEAPLANLFGSSRSPVRKALQSLEAEGLLSRRGNRGYLVGVAGAAVRRGAPTRAMLGLSEGVPEALRLPAWRALYDRVERELIHRSIFGEFRINELELSRYYRIGRTVAHDVLTQIQSTGIITRRDRAQWLTVPLNDKRINDLFDLRILIEPRLCASAAHRIPAAQLADMRARLVAGADQYPDVTSRAMDELERDLHIRILAHGSNVELVEALRRTRCILISAKHTLGRDLPYPTKTEFFFEEHLRVLEALQRGHGVRAGQAVAAHIEASRPRVLERLARVRDRHRVRSIPFISPA